MKFDILYIYIKKIFECIKLEKISEFSFKKGGVLLE